jgi:hypothetical protein
MADDDSTLYEIRDSPGQGKGVFASKDIASGTRIWEESTLIVTEQDTVLDVLEQFDALERIRPENIEKFKQLRHVGHLPPIPGYHPRPQEVIKVPPPNMNRGLVRAAEAAMYMTEVNAGGNRMPKPEYAGMGMDMRNVAPQVLSIFENNAFPIPRYKEDVKTKAVFFTGAHLNHSCIPNCNAVWNNDTKKLCVHAVRNIPAGEELCITYHADDLIKMQREQRIKLLKDMYGFNCSCPACDPSSKASTRMDAIAASKYRIKPFLKTDNEDNAKLVGEYTKLLDLMEEDDNLDNWQKGTV